jgi:hypothetical protein
MQAQNRDNAAFAGCGQGKDQPALDEAAKARWRKQAVEWLKADLAFWTKQIGTGPAKQRPFVAETLGKWKAARDLAGIREQAALAKLPKQERIACRALWAEVDALLKKSQEAKHSACATGDDASSLLRRRRKAFGPAVGTELASDTHWRPHIVSSRDVPTPVPRCVGAGRASRARLP